MCHYIGAERKIDVNVNSDDRGLMESSLNRWNGKIELIGIWGGETADFYDSY